MENEHVDLTNFIRAETDHYLSNWLKESKLGEFTHNRELASIDDQLVIRANRDTLYSFGIFDLDSGPVTITLPETNGRFMSLQAISQDHYTFAIGYAPGKFTLEKSKASTRYITVIVRTLVNPTLEEDFRSAHLLQNKIKIEQAGKGKFEVPRWDKESLDEVRMAILNLAPFVGNKPTFGTKEEVDPIHHLVGTAAGWGGNPKSMAVYELFYVEKNDGKTPYVLNVKDVPVDGFWSVSVYDSKGYFKKNNLNLYTLNSLTAKPNKDGSYTIQFGGNEDKNANYIPIMEGWNYTVRLYKPRKEIIDGKWSFPLAQPLKSMDEEHQIQVH